MSEYKLNREEQETVNRGNKATRGRKQTESRDDVFTNLWCKHGCPEKMTIHIRKTGETIVLINGLSQSHETLSGKNNALLIGSYEAKKRRLRVSQPETLTRLCEHCQKAFQPERITARFCSSRCRLRAQRLRAEQMKAATAQQIFNQAFASCSADRPNSSI